jgi:hypothetical protein
MAVDFPGHPMFPPGFNSPTRFEADVYDCEVWGDIPTGIEGNFYRIQCDFSYRPPENEWPTGSCYPQPAQAIDFGRTPATPEPER